MKVLHIGKYYWPKKGGIENHMKMLCEGLARLGNRVRAVVSNEENSFSKEKINGVEVVRLPKLFSAFGQPIFSGLAREIEKYNPDVIHLHLPNPLAALAAMKTKKPVVITYHSDIIGKPPVLTQTMEYATKKILEKSSAIIVTSRKYVEGSNILRRAGSKIRVIPLAVETSKQKPASLAEVKKTKALLGLRDELVLLFVGRLVPYKGLRFLIGALPLLHGKFKLIVVGNGPLEVELKSLVSKLSVDKKIIFLPEQDEKNLSNLYSACDIFVLPSHMRSEAFGIVQMEAMAHGKPVVSCNIPGSGVSWVNKDSESGIVVEPESSRSLARAITKLMSSPRLRKKLGKGALERAVKFFDSKKMVIDTDKVYEAVLKKRN